MPKIKGWKEPIILRRFVLENRAFLDIKALDVLPESLLNVLAGLQIQKARKWSFYGKRL